MFLSLQYSKMVSFISSTTFSVSGVSPSKRFSSLSIATSLLSSFISQNSKSTAVLYIDIILEERPKILLKMFLIDVDRVTLPRRPQRKFLETLELAPKTFWLLVLTLLPHWCKISRPYLVSVPNY